MDRREGSCQRCGSTAIAVGDQFGSKALPVGDIASAQKTALWCSSCRKVFCGKCCGAVSGVTVLKFQCPSCAGNVRWAKVADWEASQASPQGSEARQGTSGCAVVVSLFIGVVVVVGRLALG